MLARDQGTPASRVGPSARVVVNVLRNRQPPRFLGSPYVRNITEAQETGSTIFTVRSEDADEQVRGPQIHVLLASLVRAWRQLPD